MVSCSVNQDAVPLQFQPRCCATPSKVCCSFQPRSSVPPSNRRPCQLQLQLHPCRSANPPLSLCTSTPVALQLHPCRSAPPPLSLCNSTPVALQIHPCRSATPPLSLCTSTPVALQLHPCRSATPPLSLCNPEGGPPLVFGMLHGHTSSSCILSTFAIKAATAADCKWLRWPWRSLMPQCFNSIYVRKFCCCSS